MNSLKRLEASTVNIHEGLIARCRQGDEVARYRLYGLYSGAMYNTARRIVGNTEDAEDVLQEAFVSAFRNLKSYRGEAPFGAWLKRIVINKAITSLRKKQREMLMVGEAAEELPDEAGPLHEPETLTVEQVRQRVEELPDGFRTVLTLYLFEGYDHKEIAEILGITESTSKTQYKRAKDKLRTMLTREVHYG